MIKPELTEFGLEVKNLRKVYLGSDGNEPVVALEDLDLQVKRGSFFGLLGPNGAGKSTTINILLGFLEPDSGESFVNGINTSTDTYNARKNIGYIPENVNLDF